MLTPNSRSHRKEFALKPSSRVGACLQVIYIYIDNEPNIWFIHAYSSPRQLTRPLQCTFVQLQNLSYEHLISFRCKIKPVGFVLGSAFHLCGKTEFRAKWNSTIF